MKNLEFEKPELKEINYNNIVSGASCPDGTYQDGSGDCDPDRGTF